ncbi:MAG: N(4)-(beta-N-acetylglucosaminyl)-L-asparaginase [Chloroflexota bacterium]|nr:N(4)-(beta-N-acetylglucosaminyl)-L-asparaginase [Chloroflexota bacterium]
MIIIGSANALVGMHLGWDVLTSGGSALDAVEAVTRAVEDNPEDHTVGYGGYPNILGQVELDASIVDGTGRRAGSVGALQGYRHAITVARAVMERTSHAFIVGDGAARLAGEIGLQRENLLTPEVEQIWRERLAAGTEPSSAMAAPLASATRIATDPEHVGGTVNVLAIDGEGRLASAVSTSGWAWKYPGRLGDSPVIGAGNYADGRYGAAACTGWGELAIRAGTARSIVAALARGVPIEEACTEALRDLASLAGREPEAMPVNAVALDVAGRHCAVSTKEGTKYVIQEDDMTQPEIRERHFVELT